MYAIPPSAPPTSGATQNSQSCEIAQPPANTATPVDDTASGTSTGPATDGRIKQDGQGKTVLQNGYKVLLIIDDHVKATKVTMR